jgi:hypothetical protein
VGGSALATVRTNEFVSDLPWELRQFALSPDDGELHETTVDATPDTTVDGTQRLTDFVDQNEAALVAGQAVVPSVFEGAPFLGGSSINPGDAWDAPGISDPAARRAFALGTCRGCHSSAETNTNFLHIQPNPAGTPASLSGFLLGITLSDPVSGELETFNDLQRRKTDLEGLVCRCRRRTCFEAREGIRRVH